MNNFSTRSFCTGGNNNEVPKNRFTRDARENSIYKKYSVTDITDIITEDCIAYYDADTLYHQAAANQEDKFIVVKHKTEDWEEELAGVKVFKGLGKGIKKDSWLWLKNVEREVEGKEPYTLEDFEVVEGQRLKDTHDKCLESAKVQIHTKLKRVREQFRIPKIITCVGSGDNFRHGLALCREYKGNRKGMLRPLLLKELREWGVQELGAIETPTSPMYGTIETDDLCDMLGFEGSIHYNKTGKFNKICILGDKDGYNASKMICNPDTYNKDHPLAGKFKYPQAVIVPNTSQEAGDIEIVHKRSTADYKFIGFKGLLWQMLTADGADNYSALGHLNGGMGFGEDSAYKLLKPCKTSKEALQATIDKFAELLPYGVQYTDHTGKEWDVPTMEYMNTYFRVVYMLRGLNDTMDFFKLCKAFNVDTSKVIDNNKLTPPEPTFDKDNAEKGVAMLKEMCEDVVSEIGTYKSLKKPELVDKLSVVLDKMNHMKEQFDDFYVMVQKTKEEVGNE